MADAWLDGSKSPVFTWFFAVAVVRLGHRFLLVQERDHGQRWYLPGGRARVGESLVPTACREALEETNIPISIDGIIRVQHTQMPDSTARVRAIFLASPIDDTLPKRVPDEESLRAQWVGVGELASYPVRGDEVVQLIRHVSSGGPVNPLDLLSAEGDPVMYR